METADEIKVVFLGSSGVGKSSILQRFVTGAFSTEIQATLGASFISKKMTVKDKTVKFQIWDTAGQEKYHSMSQMYYRDVGAAILVFDVTDPQSYADMINWRAELLEKGPPGIVVVIVGNKTDLLQKNDDDDELNDIVNPTAKKSVDLKKAQQYADEMEAVFVTASAKFGKGIQEIFTYIAEKANVKPKDNKEQIFLADETPKPQKSYCCSAKQK